MKRGRILIALIAAITLGLYTYGATYNVKLTAPLNAGDILVIEAPALSIPTPTPIPVPTAKTPIGVNLDRPWESGRDNYFTDLFKLARYTSGATGTDGWPLGNFNVRAISNEEAANAGTGVHYPKDTGDYTFSAKGQGTVYCAGAAIVSQSYVNGITAAIIRRTDSTQNMDVGMNNCAGPVRDIRIWRPGYANSTETFTKEIKAIVATGVAFRAMNSMETNVDSDLLAARSAVVGVDGKLDWADRPKLTDPNWTGPFGLPVELMIQLAQETGASAYINITNYASANYWSNLATLAKAKIPSTPIYLAYSNETWQRGRKDFYQGPQIQAEALAYTGTPGLQDPAYGAANDWYASQRYTLLQTYKISDAFRAVYGDVAMGTVVRVVFECQSGQPALAADTLAWAWKMFPSTPPKSKLWGLMSAPYYGASVSDTATKQQLIDGVFAGQDRKVDWSEILPQENPRRYENPETKYYSIAHAYDLNWGCYEAGLDIGGPTNRTNKIAVSYDAQSKDFTTVNIAVCMAQGCQLYMYYKATSAYGSYTFGATDDIALLTNPRFAGLAQAAQIDRRRWEVARLDKAAGYFGIAPMTAFLGNGTGLKGAYTYANGTKTFTRVDPLLEFWYQGYDTGNPFPRADIIDNAHRAWQCVWTGSFVPEYTGTHTFSFDGKWASCGILINNQAATTISLTAGVPVPVKITYASTDGEGKLRWWVTPPDGRKRIVKPSQLLPS